MKTFKLQDMSGGWFVGNFSPTCHQLEECEVACKYYKTGDADGAHIHKIATEVTVIASGHVTINGIHYTSGDVIVLEPGDPSEFHVLQDTITVVVKTPSVTGDKYPV